MDSTSIPNTTQTDDSRWSHIRLERYNIAAKALQLWTQSGKNWHLQDHSLSLLTAMIDDLGNAAVGSKAYEKTDRLGNDEGEDNDCDDEDYGDVYSDDDDSGDEYQCYAEDDDEYGGGGRAGYYY